MVRCPRCGSKRVSKNQNSNKFEWECDMCNQEFNISKTGFDVNEELERIEKIKKERERREKERRENEIRESRKKLLQIVYENPKLDYYSRRNLKSKINDGKIINMRELNREIEKEKREQLIREKERSEKIKKK